MPGVAGPLAAPAPAPANNVVREAESATKPALNILASTLRVPHPIATAEASLTGDAFAARDQSAFAPSLSGALQKSASVAEVLPDVDARPAGGLRTSGSAAGLLPAVDARQADAPHAYSSAAVVHQAVPSPAIRTDPQLYMGTAMNESPTATAAGAPALSQPGVAASLVADSASHVADSASRVADSASRVADSASRVTDSATRVADSATFPIRNALPSTVSPGPVSDSATPPIRSALHRADPALRARALTVSALPAPSVRYRALRDAISAASAAALPSAATSQTIGLPTGIYDGLTPASTAALPSASALLAIGRPRGVYALQPPGRKATPLAGERAETGQPWP